MRGTPGRVLVRRYTWKGVGAEVHLEGCWCGGTPGRVLVRRYKSHLEAVVLGWSARSVHSHASEDSRLDSYREL